MIALHETLRFHRDLGHPIETIWAAYADVSKRSHWSVPRGEEIVYDDADFREGGHDSYRCGSPGDLATAGRVTYHRINAPQQLIYSETVHHDEQLLSVALVTWTLEMAETGARVTVINQLASLVGPGMIEGHRNGHEMALDQLGHFLA